TISSLYFYPRRRYPLRSPKGKARCRGIGPSLLLFLITTHPPRVSLGILIRSAASGAVPSLCHGLAMGRRATHCLGILTQSNVDGHIAESRFERHDKPFEVERGKHGAPAHDQRRHRDRAAVACFGEVGGGDARDHIAHFGNAALCQLVEV